MWLATAAFSLTRGCIRRHSRHSLTMAAKEGYLVKEGGSYKNWKKRWVILSGPFLYYFKSPQVSVPRVVRVVRAPCARVFARCLPISPASLRR